MRITDWMQHSDEQMEMLHYLLIMKGFFRSCASIDRLFDVSSSRIVQEVAVSLQELVNRLSGQRVWSRQGAAATPAGEQTCDRIFLPHVRRRPLSVKQLFEPPCSCC